ncbi:HEAT repeat protein [Aquisphaera giovannonii]|uniref:HEAT repeat protein n=1 Tax=Aquisphaera giovannonii TaxID=406548 RepID=A0A5B9W4K3_9BACT|nr:HEAT repeat domain-containing protein [Aquisphaera giovannonii]QEH35045.1 HEAT repeat protein [Aquisphaera giovannonii]
MRRFPLRFTVRRLMAAVAVAAVVMAAWAIYFDPVRRWQWAVTDDQDGPGRWEALREVGRGRIDKATALAVLTHALGSSSYRVRETAVAGLGQLGPAARPSASALIAVLADPEPVIRARAASELIQVLPPGDPGRDEALPELRRLLGDPSPQVRLKAAGTLAEFGHGLDGLPILIDVLKRPEYLARAEALWAIGVIGPSAAPEALPAVKQLESEVGTAVAPDMSRFLRAYAPQARYLLGDRAGGLASLRALAGSPDPELAREARRVLARLPVDE